MSIATQYCLNKYEKIFFYITLAQVVHLEPSIDIIYYLKGLNTLLRKNGFSALMAKTRFLWSKNTLVALTSKAYPEPTPPTSIELTYPLALPSHTPLIRSTPTSPPPRFWHIA